MSPETMQVLLGVLTILFAGVAAVFGAREFKRWTRAKAEKLLALDAKVDNWQQEITEFATLWATAQIPDVAEIAGKISAIAVVQTIRAVRDWRKRLQAPGGLIAALTENFFWQFPQRVARAEDLDRLAQAIAKEPVLMERVMVIHNENLHEAAFEIDKAKAYAAAIASGAEPASAAAGKTP